MSKVTLHGSIFVWHITVAAFLSHRSLFEISRLQPPFYEDHSVHICLNNRVVTFAIIRMHLMHGMKKGYPLFSLWSYSIDNLKSRTNRLLILVVVWHITVATATHGHITCGTMQHIKVATQQPVIFSSFPAQKCIITSYLHWLLSYGSKIKVYKIKVITFTQQAHE